MDISFSAEFGYMSAPTSASSCSQEMCFYSAPTSPSRVKFTTLSGFQTEPTTPRTYEDANSNLDEFEFETSRRFNLSDLDIETSQKDEFDHQQEQQPTMAFADELFCDGKVLPLLPPLKLPPRLLLNGNGNKMSTQSSTASSPRSPGSVLRLPFSRHSLWNDDFDPFMVALEKVREEKRGKPKGKHGLRRTRSLSPFRFLNYESDKQVGLSASTQQPEPNPYEGKEAHFCDPTQLICEFQKEPLKQASGSPNMLSETKGLVLPRRVRLVGVVNEAPFEPKRTSVPKLAMMTKKDESQRGGSWTRKNKREKIMKFLSGNVCTGKTSAQHKLEDQTAALGKPAFLRKLDMKTGTPTQSTQWDKDETTGELEDQTATLGKPNFLRKLDMKSGTSTQSTQGDKMKQQVR